VKRPLIVSILAFTILVVGIGVYSPEGFIRVGWSADAQGNDITHVTIYQYNGTVWNLVENFTSSGGSERILDSQPINFEVYMKLNKTLASSDSEAKSFTRSNMTITRTDTSVLIWDNVPLNQSATITSDATYYYLSFSGNWTSTLAVAGVTYNCTDVYQSYY
jgi:hypothetical protein